MAGEKRLRRRPIHANSLDGGSRAEAKRQNHPPIRANPAKARRGEKVCLRTSVKRPRKEKTPAKKGHQRTKMHGRQRQGHRRGHLKDSEERR